MSEDTVLTYKLKALDDKIKPLEERIGLLESRTSKLEIQDARHTTNHTGTERRISANESTFQWLSRLILGTIIIAIVSFILSGGISGIGIL